jgi:protein-disulfide isomerase
MRLTRMSFLPIRLASAAFAVALALPLAGLPVAAQTSMPAGTGAAFKDTSAIKPPAGTKVAIFEFEDMECPACAHAFPIVHQAIDHYHIPLVRHDFPLGPVHPWSFEAAVDARYLQDKVSPKMADDYRGAVFAAQMAIASKDDLLVFNRKFFANHGLQMPFVIDPAGQFASEVKVDRALGDKVGLNETPTIFVCTPTKWIQVKDVAMLYQAIEQAQASVNTAPAVKKTAAH